MTRLSDSATPCVNPKSTLDRCLHALDDLLSCVSRIASLCCWRPRLLLLLTLTVSLNSLYVAGKTSYSTLQILQRLCVHYGAGGTEEISKLRALGH